MGRAGPEFRRLLRPDLLSHAPHGLDQVFITGGLPTLTGHADDVYRAAYRRTARHNELFFARYPDDQQLARRVAAHLGSHDVRCRPANG